MKHLHPYLRLRSFGNLTDAQKQEIIPKGKPVNPGSRLASIQDVQPGMFMWLNPNTRLFSTDDSSSCPRIPQDQLLHSTPVIDH